MDTEIKIGIIGTGQIGRAHLTDYQRIPGAEVIAVCDIDKRKVQNIAQERGIPYYFTDFNDLLKLDEIEAVDVCLHNNLHAPVTISALEAGKDVFCEKPMAGSYRDAKLMYETARRLGRKLSIQLNSLFTMETRSAHRLIKDGHIGKIYYARSCHYRRRGRPFVDGYGTRFFVKKEYSGGGALLDMGVYNIARILYLLDCPEVLTISGFISQQIGMYEERRESSNYDVEDFAVGLARLEGGIVFSIEEAWAIHLDSGSGSFIVGSKGGIKFDPLYFYSTLSDLELQASFDLEAVKARWQRCFPDEEAYDSPQAHWVSALQGRVPLIDTAGIALRTMLISEGIYLSSRLGHEVSAAEVEAQSSSTALAL